MWKASNGANPPEIWRVDRSSLTGFGSAGVGFSDHRLFLQFVFS